MKNNSHKNNAYSVLIKYDPVDMIYVASIPELQGCMAHGDSQKKAFDSVLAVRDMWLDTAREEGIEIPEPDYVRL